jgi:hypothetical protein
MDEDDSERWERRMVKTADDNENGEQFYEKGRRGTVNAKKGYCLLLLFLWLFTGFLYYGMSTLRDRSRYVCTKGM